MIIKLHGETSLNKMGTILKQVIKEMEEKAGIDANKVLVKDLEVGVVFNINGVNQMLSVEHGGVSEVFRLHVELDNKGNIKNKKDNEEESFLDDYSKAVALGSDGITYEEIDSVYEKDMLIWEHTEEAGTVKAKYFVHAVTGEKIVQYFKNDVLVGEMGYKEKEA